MPIKFISEPIEEFMVQKGFSTTAEFISIVRNWFEACDKRGVLAVHRVEHLYNLHTYLTKGKDLTLFPAKYI